MTRYTHDAAGQRIETSSSTLTTVYGYDSVGNLLTQATSSASEIAFSYSYNKNGYITGEVRKENGTTTTSTYAYDALGQLTSFLQSTDYGESFIEDFDYMDADGQPIHLDHALVGIGAKGEGLQIYNFDAKYDEWISKGIEFRWGDQLKVTGN